MSEMPYLINPRGRRRKNPLRPRPRAKRRKKAASPAQLRARKSFVAMVRERAATARKARGGVAVSLNPRRTGGSTMATRKHKRKRNPVRSAVKKRRRRPVRAAAAHTKRRRHHARVNPVGRHRVHRKHRRNPGMSGGVVKMLVQGLKDGAVVAVGRGATKLIAGKIPFGQTSAIGKGAMQLLVGVLSAMAVKKIGKSDRMAAFYLAGATSGVISALATDVPVIGPMLGDGGLGRGGGGVHAWAALPQMGAWAASPIGAPRPSNSALGGINTGWIGGDSFSDGIMS